MSENATIVVNLFSGTCGMKRACAAYVYSMLKMCGISVELSLSDSADNETFDMCDIARHVQRMRDMRGVVDVVVTDYPICLPSMYDLSGDVSFDDFLMHEFNSYGDCNMNYFIENRRDCVSGSDDMSDVRMKVWMIDNRIDFFSIGCSVECFDDIVESVVAVCDKLKKS